MEENLSQSAGSIAAWRPGSRLPPDVILHLYFASFDLYQSRAYRAGATALAGGLAHSILYVGHDYARGPEFETPVPNSLLWNVPIGQSVYRGRIARTFRLPLWWWRIYRVMRNSRATMIQCHSLAALPVAAALKVRSGTPLLYDAHELETERSGWPALVRRFARICERSLLRLVDHTVVVNETIEKWYRAAYRTVRISTIRNLPRRPKVPPTRNNKLRSRLGIPENDIIFIYVGLIGAGRGIELMLEAFRQVAPDRHLVLLGSGALFETCAAASQQVPNIHVHASVPPDEILDLVAGADVGLVIFEQNSLSYAYSLPNKLFECLGAGLPVIANDMPEVTRMLAKTGRGWTLPALNATALRDMVSSLSREDIRTKVAAPVEVPYWDAEEPKLLQIMRDVVGGGSAPQLAPA